MKRTGHRWLLSKTKYCLPGVGVLSVLYAVLAYSSIQVALFSQSLIDEAVKLITDGTVTDIGACLRLPALYMPIAGVAAVVVLQILLNVLGSAWGVRLTAKLEIRLQQDVFSTLLHSRYESFRHYHSGELIHRLTADVQQVVSGVVTWIPSAVSMLTKLISGWIVLWGISPPFAAVFAAFGAVISVCSRFYGAYMKRLHKACQETEGRTRACMQEQFGNVEAVKAFSGEERVEKQLHLRQLENYRLRIKRNNLNNVGNTALYLLVNGAYYGGLVWGAVCLIGKTMTFGMLTALLQIFGQLQTPLRNASSLLTQYYAMMASVERLQELETLPKEETSPSLAEQQRYRAAFSALQGTDITFAYENEEPILERTAFFVNRGEVVTLVGRSGIGKSTLMKLVLAILYPAGGELEAVCGEERLPLSAATRFLFSYVPQGRTVFAGTLRDNLSFFRDGLTEQELNAAVKTACLDELVASLPEGLDTELGEHGFDISEGQAQRIAIARALLNDAPILLLDECTSALDKETENRILQNIRAMTDKTVLMISHRDAAVEGSDRIYLVRDHQLIEQYKAAGQ